MTSVPVLLRRVRRAVLGRRRMLAALLAAIAVAAGLRAVTAPPTPTVQMVVAAHSVPSGTVLTEEHLRETAYLPDAIPAGALPARELVGRTTAAPLTAGEPLTSARIVRGSLLDGYPGSVALPVRVGDAAAVRLLRVGDRIDLLAAVPDSAVASVLASDVPVIALPDSASASDGASDGDSEGGLVIVAIPDETARRAASLMVSAFIYLDIRR